MSERNNRSPVRDGVNVVDVINRTLRDKFITILSIAEKNGLKIHAHIQGGPTLILAPDPDEGWVSSYPNKELVRLLGDLVESAAD